MSKTVGKAVRVLEVLAEEPRGIAELARALGVHHTTALRMLQPLVRGGLIARAADGRYRLGLRLVEYGQQVLDEIDLRVAARPHLLALAESARATAHLVQLVDGRAVYVDKIEGASIRTWSRIGRAVSLHTSAAAKAILARLPAEQGERLLAGHDFTRFTDRTITDRAAFRAHLDDVARHGYATDRAEFEPLVHCIGVAVPGLPAAVSVTLVRTGPREPEPTEQLGALRETVAAITAGLGSAIG
ncbi:IclR family transcriptional regulator [Saccharopolyspora griseoalba]|uniref:IclR family transcriptional regulator n=1 Tax=Saccharopolyspora griseoalba TaxID=1431848 RepID=A0ABW2LJH4_9PSEU